MWRREASPNAGRNFCFHPVEAKLSEPRMVAVAALLLPEMQKQCQANALQFLHLAMQ